MTPHLHERPRKAHGLGGLGDKPKRKRINRTEAAEIHEAAVVHFFPNAQLEPTDDGKALWTDGVKNGICARVASVSESNSGWFGIHLSHVDYVATLETAYVILSLRLGSKFQHFLFPASVKDGMLHIRDLDGCYLPVASISEDKHCNLSMKYAAGRWYLHLGGGNRIDASAYAKKFVKVREHWRQARTLPTLQDFYRAELSPELLAIYEWLNTQVTVFNEMRPAGSKLRAKLVLEVE